MLESESESALIRGKPVVSFLLHGINPESTEHNHNKVAIHYASEKWVMKGNHHRLSVHLWWASIWVDHFQDLIQLSSYLVPRNDVMELPQSIWALKRVLSFRCRHKDYTSPPTISSMRSSRNVRLLQRTRWWSRFGDGITSYSNSIFKVWQSFFPK